MKIEILRPVMISGEPAAAGSILEVEDSAAWTLIRLGKAVEHQEEAAAPEVVVEEKPSKEEAPKPKTTRRRTKQ